MGPEGPRLTRRGPGRPPFRKAQSAACMEISLPVSHTEGVCLSTRLPSLSLSNLLLLLTSACHARTPGVSGLRPDAWLTRGKAMLMQGGLQTIESRKNSWQNQRSSSVVEGPNTQRLSGHGFDLQQDYTQEPASRAKTWTRIPVGLCIHTSVWKLMDVVHQRFHWSLILT